jgi:F-type H+-transporting ATPase subunit delta
MNISKQARRDAQQLFKACVAGGVLDEARVRQTVALVIQQKPRGYLSILKLLVHLVQLEIERRTATVESAISLAPDQQAAVKANLDRVYGTGLAMNFSANPALIGGLRVRVGSDVFDGSVRGRLEVLKASF